MNVCSAVSQSPNSLLVGKRAIRFAAASETADARSASVRLAVENRLDECGAAVPAATAGATFGERLRKLSERALEQHDEVDRVAPRVRLLHPLGARELRGERGEHRLGAVPAGHVERLERLVHEVERVAAVEVAVVGGGGEEHVCERARRRACPDRGHQRALRALGVADLDEAAEPECEALRVRRAAWERVERETRRLRRRVGGDVGDAVVEGSSAVAWIEPRREVHEAGERGQAAEPAAAAAGDAEVEAGAKDLDPARVGLQEGDRRLRKHERNVPLEPVAQPLALVRDRAGRRAQIDEDIVAVELDREPPQLVGPLVERATRAEIEARVMPVAGEDPVADGAAVERKAHVRATVVDRVHRVALTEQADRLPVEVDDEAPRRAQLRQRRGTDETFRGNGGHGSSFARRASG